MYFEDSQPEACDLRVGDNDLIFGSLEQELCYKCFALHRGSLRRRQRLPPSLIKRTNTSTGFLFLHHSKERSAWHNDVLW